MLWQGEIIDKQGVNRGSKRANRTELSIGFLGLSIGVLFYFVGRPKGATYFQSKLPHVDRMFPYIPDLLGRVTGSFPSFMHPFSFSLIGMGLISQTRRSRILVCSIFLILNLFFEMGQRYKEIVADVTPDWVGTLPVLMNMKQYFLKGTFAISDVVAACLGSATALMVTEIMSKQSKGGGNT
jgi:hypothetical protein